MVSLDNSTLNNMRIALDPSVPNPDGHCFFWGLPAELRNIVYQLGHSRDTDKPMQQKQARRIQLTGQQTTLIPLISYIARYLFNKQYAEEAYALFVATTHFDFCHCSIFNTFPNANLPSSFSQVTRFAASLLDVCFGAGTITKYMSHLKSVTLIANTVSFGSWAELSLRDDEPDKLDIMLDTVTEDTTLKLGCLARVKQIRGLQSVKFKTTSNLITAPKACRGRYQSNIKTMKAAIAKSLMREKEVEVAKEIEKTKDVSKVKVDGRPKAKTRGNEKSTRAAEKVTDKDIPIGTENFEH